MKLFILAKGVQQMQTIVQQQNLGQQQGQNIIQRGNVQQIVQQSAQNPNIQMQQAGQQQQQGLQSNQQIIQQQNNVSDLIFLVSTVIFQDDKVFKNFSNFISENT